MPQLDVTSFFNQVSWLTAAFMALLPLFYAWISAPYSRSMAARGRLARCLALVKPRLAASAGPAFAAHPGVRVHAPDASRARAHLSLFRAKTYSALV